MAPVDLKAEPGSLQHIQRNILQHLFSYLRCELLYDIDQFGNSRWLRFVNSLLRHRPKIKIERVNVWGVGRPCIDSAAADDSALELFD